MLDLLRSRCLWRLQHRWRLPAGRVALTGLVSRYVGTTLSNLRRLLSSLEHA